MELCDVAVTTLVTLSTLSEMWCRASTFQWSLGELGCGPAYRKPKADEVVHRGRHPGTHLRCSVTTSSKN